MAGYQEKHYEDVARLLNKQPVASVGSLYQAVKRMGEDFADLFAADNPRTCPGCGDKEGTKSICAHSCGAHHIFTGGFDRERFLAACGLKS